MKEHYINIEPLMYDFISIFDIPFNNGFENGDIAYHIENYNGKEITAKELYDNMITCSFGIFGCTHTVPEIVEDMKIEIVEQEKNYFVVFQLAPFLGLPNNDWREELKELKLFLEWVENQKKGYREVEKQCDDLWISMDSLSLMSMEEQMKILKNRPLKKKEYSFKTKRKNRF